MIEHKLSDDIVIVKMLVKDGSNTRKNSTLFKYKKSNSDKVLEFKCMSFQTVITIFHKSGFVPKDSAILSCEEGCKHSIIAFGMCGICGEDLKDDDSYSSENSVSMLHAIPQVTE